MKKANKNIITTTGLEITTPFIKNSFTRYARNKVLLEFPLHPWEQDEKILLGTQPSEQEI